MNELNDKKKFFDDLMTNDFTNLNNKFNNYLDHLKNINLKDSSEVQKQKASKEKYNYLNSFSLERIKFLDKNIGSKFLDIGVGDNLFLI